MYHLTIGFRIPLDVITVNEVEHLFKVNIFNEEDSGYLLLDKEIYIFEEVSDSDDVINLEYLLNNLSEDRCKKTIDNIKKVLDFIAKKDLRDIELPTVLNIESYLIK